MPKYFEFDITLEGTKPRVWRKFLIAKDRTTFFDLHQAIQHACGWFECHLWHFIESKRPFQKIAEMGNQPDMDFPGFNDPSDKAPAAEDVFLSSYFKRANQACLYEYDFGDGWVHKVTLKKTVDMDAHFFRRLTGGKWAFPPEDCGGIPGFYASIAAIKPDLLDPKLLDMFHPDELADRREWMADSDWDPEDFDRKAVSKQFDMESVDAT